jgi:hypothetical protein
MQIIIFITTIFFVYSIYMGGYIVYRNPRAKINRLFAYFSFILAVWYFGTLFRISAPTKEIALIWFRIETSGWSFTEPLFLHFMLRLTKNKVFEKHPWLFVLLYIPAPFFTYNTIIEMNIIPGLFMSSTGWVLSIVRDTYPLRIANNIYMMTTVISIPLLIYWGKTEYHYRHILSFKYTLFLNYPIFTYPVT